MKKIMLLDLNTANQIAAGEVVARPASVVKELVENAIDAGAANITVEIKNGGVSFIRVTDNGSGILPDDVETAFLPHATSKITSISDLENLNTMGFRGEALASIAAVSKVEVLTKVAEMALGSIVVVEAGKLLEKDEAGCPNGSTFVVRNLFFNTPARMKFLKKDTTEAAVIAELIDKLAMGHPGISFRFINNGRESLFTQGNNDLKATIQSVYGKDIASALLLVDYEYEGIKITGFAGLPQIARPSRSFQNFYVNARFVKSKCLQNGAEEAYKSMLMVGKYPVLVLKAQINPAVIDVNVHPTKQEIKFSDEKKVYDAVYWAVKNALFAAPKERDVESLPESAKNASFRLDTKEKYETAVPFPFQNTGEKEKLFVDEIVQMFKREEPLIAQGTRNDSDTLQEEIFENSYIKSSISKDLIVLPEENKMANTEGSVVVIGQLFNSYIICQKADQMLLIDQHAAHERLTYEELVKNDEINSQLLLAPVMVDVSKTEFVAALQNEEFIAKLGLSFEEFGNNSFIIRQAPVQIDISQIGNLFLEILEIIKDNKKQVDVWDKAVFSVACKNSIKANRRLCEAELQNICDKVMALEGIHTCPHGRPIIISFDKKFIEKQFKRIV